MKEQYYKTRNRPLKANNAYTMDLFDHLMKKNPSGIGSEDAKQLFLWLYCTLDLLPKRFRHLKLGRPELVQLFTRIASESKILVSDDATRDSIKTREFWEDLVDQLLRNKISLQRDFPSRVATFL
jgi:hypothetical protein